MITLPMSHNGHIMGWNGHWLGRTGYDSTGYFTADCVPVFQYEYNSQGMATACEINKYTVTGATGALQDMVGHDLDFNTPSRIISGINGVGTLGRTGIVQIKVRERMQIDTASQFKAFITGWSGSKVSDFTRSTLTKAITWGSCVGNNVYSENHSNYNNGPWSACTSGGTVLYQNTYSSIVSSNQSDVYAICTVRPFFGNRIRVENPDNTTSYPEMVCGTYPDSDGLGAYSRIYGIARY